MDPNPTTPDAPDAGIKCPKCGKPFKSAQALAAHTFRAHTTAGKAMTVRLNKSRARAATAKRWQAKKTKKKIGRPKGSKTKAKRSAGIVTKVDAAPHLDAAQLADQADAIAHAAQAVETSTIIAAVAVRIAMVDGIKALTHEQLRQAFKYVLSAQENQR